MPSSCAPDLRVARQNGGGIHQQVGPLHIFSGVGDLHVDAHRPLVIDDVALVDVAAGDGIPGRVQDLHDGKHAAAPDAHEMQSLFTL